jgi:hypothetical protein
VATADTEQQLAWEARQRPRAGIAAALAAVLTLAADLWSTGILRDAPKGGFLDSLQRALQPGDIGSAPSLRTPYFQWIHDHSTALVLANVVKGLGFLAVAWALTFLIAATRARRPEVARPVIYVALVGAVLSALAGIAFWGGYTSAVNTFLDGPHTVDRAADAGNGSLMLTAQFIGLAGQLALAVGYVFVALNAMRAGLLTRFMGILGCIIGVLVIIPLGPLPIVQTFWLVALAALFFGFWPSGMPPAWTSGESVPWPRQAEAAAKRREAMDARRAARGGGGGSAPSSSPDAAAVAAPAPARTKKKRKRR